METVENVSEYHSVFANSIISAMNAILGKDKLEASKLMIFMIEYSYTQYKEEENSDMTFEEIMKEIEKLNLQEKSIDELAVMMSYYQAKAKMKPVQNRVTRARIFGGLRGRL